MTLSITLPDQEGNLVTLPAAKDRKTILFFYPAAMTPGCTVEACDFRDRYDDLRQAGYDLIGISPDPPAKNAKFREKEGLPFPLLSDQDHRVADSLGAWGPKKNYGKEYMGLIRSTFVIDGNGEIEKAYRNVKATGHVAIVTRDLLE